MLLLYVGPLSQSELQDLADRLNLDDSDVEDHIDLSDNDEIPKEVEEFSKKKTNKSSKKKQLSVENSKPKEELQSSSQDDQNIIPKNKLK